MENSKYTYRDRVSAFSAWMYLDGSSVDNFQNVGAKAKSHDGRYNRTWGADQECNYLNSIAKNYPNGEIVARRVHDEKGERFEIVDGFARMNVLSEFFKKVFSVTEAGDLELPPIRASLFFDPRTSRFTPVSEVYQIGGGYVNFPIASMRLTADFLKWIRYFTEDQVKIVEGVVRVFKNFNNINIAILKGYSDEEIAEIRRNCHG